MTTEERKFGELILYLARLSEGDPKCGRTKLNKLLFYVDFRAYERFGASVSGQRYQKRDYGPTAGSFMPVVRALEEEQACVWVDRVYHGKPMKKLIARREPISDCSGRRRLISSTRSWGSSLLSMPGR